MKPTWSWWVIFVFHLKFIFIQYILILFFPFPQIVYRCDLSCNKKIESNKVYHPSKPFLYFDHIISPLPSLPFQVSLFSVFKTNKKLTTKNKIKKKKKLIRPKSNKVKQKAHKTDVIETVLCWQTTYVDVHMLNLRVFYWGCSHLCLSGYIGLSFVWFGFIAAVFLHGMGRLQENFGSIPASTEE